MMGREYLGKVRTTGRALPLLTVSQRIRGLWQSTDWPVCVKVIKANIALTITLGLFLIHPIREWTGASGILASVAVEFVHPSKSYGFLAEDVAFGGLMCSLSGAWSLLGIYLASLTRLPDTYQVQPPSSAVLFVFLIIGCFFLSIVRIKNDKANVGGMLAATIMVLSLTSAVFNDQFTALPTIQALVSTLVGFFLIFLIFLLVFPENSTRVFVEQLISLLELLDATLEQQVHGFLKTEKTPAETVAILHTHLDLLISALIQKKKMARREPSYNRMAPTDISELTTLIKQIHVPLRGLGVTRAMEENMRHANVKIRKSALIEEEDENSAQEKIQRPQSVYGDTDDEETSGDSDSQKGRWQASIKVMTYWKDDYDTILELVNPTYLHLTRACSLALQQSILRLCHLQSIDPRSQGRPFFYRLYYQWKSRNEKAPFDPDQDPSVPLYEAIRYFHKHRLQGLEKLYTSSGIPRRVLFLLLTFQFNLHAFAKLLYTLTSLIYELDRCRTQRKVWWPHLSFYAWLFQSYATEEAFALETPAAIIDATHSAGIHKTLSKRATTIAAQATNHRQARIDIENPSTLFRLETPYRGKVCTVQEHRHNQQIESDNIWRQTPLDPLGYHDPDVSYPTTRSQRFFYHLDRWLQHHVLTAETAFAMRAVVVVVFLSLPAFLSSSAAWYAETRAQWALVTALIWMGPSVGSNFFGTMTRTVGTLIGAVQSILIWEISRGQAPGLVILSFLVNLPWLLVYIRASFWKSGGLFALITTSLILGNTYNTDPHNQTNTIFVITYERTVACIAGVVAALIISIFPYPKTGRVELRHRISSTIGELGSLYSTFLALLVRDTPEDPIHRRADRKLFQSVATKIRQQIKGERVLLEQSRFEPTLRGVFPEDKYLQLIQLLENISGLLIGMEFVVQKISFEWRMMVVQDTWKARKQMIASYLTALHMSSDSLTNKAPLPPYVIRPTKARRVLTNLARKMNIFKKSHLGEREYTYYSTYIMYSEQLAVELELLVGAVRDLVGPDSASIWLNYRH
ncbi:hypothetical protein BY458DRAFT_455541 [Sporodiniella umbellata]|nr:hypothetical protein BY458DRAFT_455541 [Sporodiniella umbellata]